GSSGQREGCTSCRGRSLRCCCRSRTYGWYRRRGGKRSRSPGGRPAGGAGGACAVRAVLAQAVDGIGELKVSGAVSGAVAAAWGRCGVAGEGASAVAITEAPLAVDASGAGTGRTGLTPAVSVTGALRVGAAVSGLGAAAVAIGAVADEGASAVAVHGAALCV